jgi:hypothetical protein
MRGPGQPVAVAGFREPVWDDGQGRGGSTQKRLGISGVVDTARQRDIPLWHRELNAEEGAVRECAPLPWSRTGPGRTVRSRQKDSDSRPL